MFKTLSICVLIVWGSCVVSAQVKPSTFQEETNPTDDNFETYSQKGGVNRRAKLSSIAKFIGPLVESTPISFTPPASGNTNYLRKFVLDPNGNWHFIDALGNAFLVKAAPAKVYEEFTGVTGSTITPTGAIPASNRNWRINLYRSGIRLQYIKDFTISGGAINLVLAAQNEDFTLIIE